MDSFIAHAVSIDDIEAYTLIGTVEDKKKYCGFQNLDLLRLFVRSLRIDPSLLIVRRRHYLQLGLRLYTCYCPLPFGNPFILRFLLNDDNSGRMQGSILMY